MKDSKRVGLLDEIRGFAIICMVVYHLLFSLKNFYSVDVPVFFDDWFDIIRSIFAGAFIFISGTVCRFSRSNLKRGAQCFFLGMLITFAVALVQPAFQIHFGILHLLGICMIIYALAEAFFDFVPPLAGILIFGFLFFALFGIPYGNPGFIGFNGLFTIPMPAILYNAEVLFPLGFRGPYANYADYFPLLPWFCVFAAGSFFGVYVRENALPRWFYKTRVRFLAATGRYTIWIYLLHQPIIIAILNIIFNER
ncbi:MAG: DUF1624 domain-containing protein [Oscillospiraceae bacterium]|jgi:uncharacterized membrane protein|nr:DUF1624 domain-containing protein [Oscillospiraceae bacterium]